MGLTGALLCYAGGLLVAPYLFLPETLPFLILAAIAAWGLTRSSRLAIITLILLFFCIGLFQYKISISPPKDPKAIHYLSDRGPVVLEGVIYSIKSRFPQGLTCTVSITSSFIDGLKGTQTGNLLLIIDQIEEKLTAGDRIRFQTQLRAPREFGTPGEFIYTRHLAYQRIFTTGFVPVSSDIVRLQNSATLTPRFILKRWSQRVGEIIDRSVPSHLAPYLRGLATGDRGALSPEQRELLAHSGLSHLFAISGLHLGIIASFLYLLFLSVYRRVPPLIHLSPPRRALPLIILPIVAAYVLFTGSAISTLRALIGLAAISSAFFLRRQVAPLQLLATVAFIILLLDPLAIFTPAFQLSFAGAAGILAVTPRWMLFCQGRPKLMTYPATLFIITLAATLSTLPLVLLHFHIFAPAGLILNMIAVPAVTLLAVPLCLAGVVTSVFSPDTASLIFNLAATVLDTLLSIASSLLSLPGFAPHYIYFSMLVLLGIGLLTLTLIIPMRRHNRIAGLMLAGLLFLGSFIKTDHTDKLSLVVISVGQGDAALVTDTTGKTFLIDGGGFFRSNFDTGERLVAPTLGYLGVREIDTVVLTHDHPDHINGLIHILKHFPVSHFWSGVEREKLPESLIEILTERKIPIRTFSENWTIVNQNNHATIATYRVPNRPKTRNDQSLVLYFNEGNDGLLLTGDLETLGIEKLSLAPPPGPVTLLKLPHHGSRYSNPQPLLEQYKPQTVFISVGYHNRYGQPHDDVLSLFKNQLRPPERTDLSGSLFFQTDGKRWETQRWVKGVFR